jgi:hypothetical protein
MVGGARMTRHDSDSDLAGRLGAQLTPPVPHIIARHRGEESSGFFDLAAMQAADLEQVMLRAQDSHHLRRAIAARSIARPSSVSPLAWSEPEIRWLPEPQPRRLDLMVDDTAGHARGRGVGWFGIAVAWLATTTTGALIATTVPAHVAARVRVAPPVATVTASPSSPATTNSALHAPLAIPTPAVTAQAWTVVSPSEAPATPVLGAAGVPTATAHRRAPAAPRPAAIQGADAPLTIRPTAAPRTSAAAATPAAVAETGAPKSAPAPSTPAAPGTAASPPPPAGTSLEDLIRREVAAESKRH